MPDGHAPLEREQTITLLGFISAEPYKVRTQTRIKIIRLIKVVLKALNPDLIRHSKRFWGRGASIFGLRYEYLQERGTCILVLNSKW